MKLIITGASGNIGQMIVPILSAKGAELILFGRDATKLKNIFPNYKTATYDELSSIAESYNGILHLAVLNNDKRGNFDDFNDANIEFLKKTLSDIEHAKLKFFIYPTSLHSSDANGADNYSKTKQIAEKLLREVTSTPVRIMRLPAAYENNFSGKLAILNNYPPFLKEFLFNILRSFKPTVSVKKIADTVMLGEQNELEVLVTDQQDGNWFYVLTAKLIDLSFSVFVILTLWWLVLLCFFFIKLSSPGPGIFAQTRVGLKGKNFICYKLRTMKTGTAQRGTHDVTVDNITVFGNFLRKTKIDELPQVVNILKGEMSLIGPRPCLPMQQELIKERSERGVFNYKPGITGWSQINSIDMSVPEKLAKSDKYFINMRTLPMLFKIIVATAFRKS